MSGAVAELQRVAAGPGHGHGPGQVLQLARRALAELIGTGLLLIAVTGSGIAAQSLSPGDTGLALLENAAATGAALVAIILAVGPVSGAHLNPVVSCADALFRGLRLVELVAYVVAQLVGATLACGVVRVLWPRADDLGQDVVVPHATPEMDELEVEHV